jgi:hypothetical protein
MRFLRALLTMFRRPAPSDYETEAMFAGWVDLPPQLRAQKPEIAPEPAPVTTVATAAQALVLPAAPTLQ